MKNLYILGLVTILVVSQSSFASDGTRGGGDECKNTINQYRETILGWIGRDEAKDLNFKTAKAPGWTYNDPAPAKSYKSAMTAALQEGKVVVTCYLDPARINDPAARALAAKDGISYKAITIGTPPLPTTCVNYEDASGTSHIDCNYDLIMDQNSLGDTDYVTVHHEYASIAGVELRTNSYTSDFSISNQISQFEHWKQVLVLGPKNQSETNAVCGDIISDFTNIITNQCFVPAQKLLTLPSQGAENSRNELIMEFHSCLQQQRYDWGASDFSKTCSSTDAQVACLNRCKDMGLLSYCFPECGSL